MLFNEEYSSELNNTYKSFYDYYTKLIQIKDFLELSIKEYETTNGIFNKKNENILTSSLPEKSKTQKKQINKEIVKIEEKKSEVQIKNTQLPKKDVVKKQTRQVDKINIEQAILKCKII